MLPPLLQRPLRNAFRLCGLALMTSMLSASGQIAYPRAEELPRAGETDPAKREFRSRFVAPPSSATPIQPARPQATGQVMWETPAPAEPAVAPAGPAPVIPPPVAIPQVAPPSIPQAAPAPSAAAARSTFGTVNPPAPSPQVPIATNQAPLIPAATPAPPIAVETPQAPTPAQAQATPVQFRSPPAARSTFGAAPTPTPPPVVTQIPAPVQTPANAFRSAPAPQPYMTPARTVATPATSTITRSNLALPEYGSTVILPPPTPVPTILQTAPPATASTPVAPAGSPGAVSRSVFGSAPTPPAQATAVPAQPIIQAPVVQTIPAQPPMQMAPVPAGAAPDTAAATAARGSGSLLRSRNTLETRPGGVTTAAGPAVTGFMPDAALTLNNLDQLLRRPNNTVLPVHLCFPGTQVLNQLQLAQGAAVAQALALRCGYDPIVITHGNQVRPEAFNVMLGTMTELQAYLLPSEARQVNYSFLALRRLVGAQGYLLIVTGVDINAVSDGILALGFARQSLPESNTAAIREVIVPDNPPFIRREPLQAASSYTLLQLEETNNPISLGPDGGLIVDVFLPGYVSVVPDVNVEIRVHFAQRARAFAGGNAIVLKVNDREIARSKPSEVVASPLGGNEVLFSIPMQSFDPGRNLLHFTNAAAADQEGFRLGPDDLQIFADTTIMMPQVTDPVVLPDLRVTSRTFFPFIGQPDGSQITILLTDMSQNTINSAWTFMARMAQMANTFFYAADIGTEIIDPSRDVVVIGRYSGIPSGIQRLIQLSAFDYQSLSEEDLSLNETVRGVNLRIFLQDNWQRMKSGGLDQSMEDPESPAVPGSSSAQNFLYLTCIPPDQERTRWTLILTAFGGATLEERTAMLVQEDVWSRLRGTIARLGDKPGTLQTFVPSEAKFIDQTYDFVEMPLGQRIDLRFWFIASGISLLLLIILTVKLLSKIEAATVGQNRS